MGLLRDEEMGNGGPTLAAAAGPAPSFVGQSEALEYQVRLHTYIYVFVIIKRSGKGDLDFPYVDSGITHYNQSTPR